MNVFERSGIDRDHQGLRSEIEIEQKKRSDKKQATGLMNHRKNRMDRSDLYSANLRSLDPLKDSQTHFPSPLSHAFQECERTLNQVKERVMIAPIPNQVSPGDSHEDRSLFLISWIQSSGGTPPIANKTRPATKNAVTSALHSAKHSISIKCPIPG